MQRSRWQSTRILMAVSLFGLVANGVAAHSPAPPPASATVGAANLMRQPDLRVRLIDQRTRASLRRRTVTVFSESKMITAMDGSRNDQSRLIFERDRYYTVISTIRASGDVDESNNRSVRVGRIDANRRGTLLVNWEPIAYRSTSGGTVQVNAPPRP